MSVRLDSHRMRSVSGLLAKRSARSESLKPEAFPKRASAAPSCESYVDS